MASVAPELNRLSETTNPSSPVGYLIPEFPGQTHVIFEREIERLVELGQPVQIISTRCHRVNTCKHESLIEKSKSAFYLFPFNPLTNLAYCLTRPRQLASALSLLREVSPRLVDRGKNLAFLLCGAKLARFAAQIGMTHVHSQTCGQGALILAYAKRLGGPTYSLTLINPLKVFGPHQPQKWRDAAFALVLTQRLREEVHHTLNGDLPDLVKVAPLGVDTTVYHRSRPYEPWRGAGPARVFACGRLNPCKGHADLIHAVARLRGQGLNVTLAIAGEVDNPASTHRTELEALIRQLGLEGAVSLLGALSEPDVRAQHGRAHVFCLASWEEPLGVAIIEAMAMSLPVVTTRAGGVPEIIDDQIHGVLVHPRDPGALAAAIGTILQDPNRALRLGAAARERICDRFSSDLSARLILRLLQQSRPVELTPAQGAPPPGQDRPAGSKPR